MKKRMISVFTIVFILINIFSVCYVANAEETTSSTKSSTRKYLGETVYAGHSEGYSLNEKIEKDNPHFGWALGNFYVSGFTRVIDENTLSESKTRGNSDFGKSHTIFQRKSYGFVLNH